MCVRWGQDLQLGQRAGSWESHACVFFISVVKKKGTTGLKLSNLMNLGRKKSSSLDSPERSLETSSKWQHESLCRVLSQGWISVCRAG